MDVTMTNSNMEIGLIRYIYNSRCKFDEPNKVMEIEKSVKTMLGKLFQRVAEINPAFEMSKIVDAGSFYEGTKIGKPDEFDFMVVLKDLSLPNAISVSTGCVPWYENITVSELKSDMYQNYFESGQKLSIQLMNKWLWNYIQQACIGEHFETRLPYGTIKVVSSSCKKLLVKYIGHNPFRVRNDSNNQQTSSDFNRSGSSDKDNSIGNIKANHAINNHSTKNTTATDETNNASISDYKSLPMTGILQHVDNMEIGVDIMLALEYPNISKIVCMEGFPKEHEEIIKRIGCHLVAKKCQNELCSTCWHISLASTELHLMRAMDQKHKDIYKVLKYLLTREINKQHRNKCVNLSSYMLKNAVLFHRYGQTDCENHVSRCLHAILKYLALQLKIGQMPCYLSRNIQTWGHFLKFPVLTLNDPIISYELYGVLWMELLRKVVVQAGKYLEQAGINLEKEKSFDNIDMFDKFAMMKEYLICVISNYCNGDYFKDRPMETFSWPRKITHPDVQEKILVYCKRLDENFQTRLVKLLL